MSATEWFDQHETLVAELRAATPAAPEHLRERVLDFAPARRRHFSFSLPRGRRQLALVVVPLALAGAVTAALVHGFVGSSGSNQRPPVAAGRASLPIHGLMQGSARKLGKEHGTPNGTSSSYNSYGAGDFTTAKTHGQAFSSTNTNGPTFSGSVAAGAELSVQKRAASIPMSDAITIPKDRLVHADAALEVRVASHAALTRATNKATQIVAGLGGYAQSVQYQASHRGSGNAYLSLRVPVRKTELAMGKLAALGSLLSQQVQTQDLEQTFTHQTSKIGALRRTIAIYQQALRDGTVSGSQRVETQIKLANAEHQVTQLRKARGQTLASAATADIQLTLTTSKQSVVGPPAHRGRFDRMLRGAAGFLGLEGIVVLYALVVLSPVLILGGLGWGLVRERRRRDERRLLASA